MKQQKHLILFLAIAIILGLFLSSFFYFLANFQKKILNLLGLLVLFLLIAKSFWNRRDKVFGNFTEKLVHIIPNYFYIMNIILFILILLPNLIMSFDTNNFKIIYQNLREQKFYFLVASIISFIITILFIIKIATTHIQYKLKINQKRKLKND